MLVRGTFVLGPLAVDEGQLANPASRGFGFSQESRTSGVRHEGMQEHRADLPGQALVQTNGCATSAQQSSMAVAIATLSNSSIEQPHSQTLPIQFQISSRFARPEHDLMG